MSSIPQYLTLERLAESNDLNVKKKKKKSYDLNVKCPQ